MSKEDWIEVGLRVLGVYFIVSGLLAFLQTGLALFIAGHADTIAGIVLIVPALEMVIGVSLLYIKLRRDINWRRE